jgi:hypothetical protein
MGPNSSDEEYSQWLQRFALKERERRTFHPAAIEPETSPLPQWPTGESRIQVKEAAHLLEAGCPLPPIAKPNDSDLRSDLIKSDRYLEIVNLILSNSQEGRAPLIHPTLGVTVACPADPDKDWFMGQEVFEQLGNELLCCRAATTSLPPLADAASGAPLDNAAAKPADTSSGDQRTAERAEPEKPAIRRPGLSSTKTKIQDAAKLLIDAGKIPAETIGWKEFCKEIRKANGVTSGHRGYSEYTIQAAVLPLLSRLNAGSTESTEN